MAGPIAQSPRALMPDYLRLIALFGIVVVNVQFIGFSVLHGFATPWPKARLMRSRCGWSTGWPC